MGRAYNMADFVAAVLETFPELREDFEEDEGLPYLQIGYLATFAQRAKREGDWETYKRCVEIVDRFWRRADPELKNALGVSFLEHIDFRGPRGVRAWELLTPSLQEAWRAVNTGSEQGVNTSRRSRRGSR